MSWFSGLHPILQAFLACCFTWAVTALGASLVFFFQGVNRKLLDSMMGFAAGVMLAASFWSLLEPAVRIAGQSGAPGWIPAVIGFLVGGFTLRLIDKLLPHLHAGFPTGEAEGLKTSWQRSVLLILAITLHNIPEGLAVGVAFGALHYRLPGASMAASLALALGIGIQNFPEGVAVSMPLRREGFPLWKCFWYGQLSAIVEPIAALLGAAAVIQARSLMPYALAFAAGAMIFVVVEQLIPEAQREKNTDLATLGTLLGFALMMSLDVALG